MLQNDYNALRQKVKTNLEQILQIHMKETMKLLDPVPKSDQNMRSSDSNIKRIVEASTKEKRYSQPSTSNVINLMTLNLSKGNNNNMSNNGYIRREIKHSSSSSSIVIVYPDPEKNGKITSSKNNNQNLSNSRVRQQISKYEEILK